MIDDFSDPPAPASAQGPVPSNFGAGGLGWLVLWTAIAAGLRFWNLDLKPPSSIEVATVGFGLGNGFGAVPVDQLVPPGALLEALRLDPTVAIAQLLDRLADQSTHPPLFFLLMHGWLTALTAPGAVATWTAARSLSALLGVAAVPLAAILAGTIARSRRAAIWAAPLMALSPYGVYLSQEARHYTLAALLAMGSWILAVRSARRFERDRPDPFSDQRSSQITGHSSPHHQDQTDQNPRGRFGAIAEVALWVLLNGLGMATHYLYGLVTVTQGLLFGALAIARSRRWGWRSLGGQFGAKLGLLAALQGATIALWIPFMERASESEMTEWVGDHLSGGDLLMVPLRLILWLLSMVMLLPIERQPWPIAIASGVLLLGGAIALGSLVWRRGREPILDPSLDRVGRWAIGAGVGGALAIFLLMAYGGRADLSVAPRYQFTYFPLVIAAIAIVLAPKVGQTVGPLVTPVRRLVLVMGAVGSLCVVQNLGFQKSIHSDRLWETVAAAVRPNAPVIVITTLDSLSEVRSAIAIAAESQRHRLPQTRLGMMLLSDRADRNDGTGPLAALLAALPPRTDLWTIGDAPHLDLEARQCQRQPDPTEDLGERLRHFHCDRPQP